MVEYVPALRIRSDSTSVTADFLTIAEKALSIGDLVDAFVDAALLEGVGGNDCYAVQGDRRVHLFGGTSPAAMALGDVATVTHRIAVTGWDDAPYEVELALAGADLSDERRACLHAMAVLYVCRGIALLDAQDDLSLSGLTAKERFCVDQVAQGQSYLDIGDELGCSVQAVKIHVQRAGLKIAV